MSDLPRKFKGVWIPANLWLNRDLSITEKVMLVEIGSLESDDRGCYASNAHFAQFFDLSVKRVSNIINDLARDGVLSISLIREGSRVVERQLRMLTPLENFHTPLENEANPSRKGYEPPLGKVTGSNTKIFNNTKRELNAVAPSNSPQVQFNGLDFIVTEAVLQKWAKAFPGVNIDLEIERASVWAAGNAPKKDWNRFLSNWLSRKSGASVDETGVPVDQVIALYHQICPNLPAVTVPSDKVLRSMIVERWNESPDHQSGQVFWLPFFQKANNRNQVFFRGQNVAPRLEALVSRAVFREISEASQ